MENKQNVAEGLVDAVKNPTCSHIVDGVACGKRAVCVIKTREGKLLQNLQPNEEEFGRGTGSVWEPICAEHKAAYPDHEGFELNGTTPLS